MYISMTLGLNLNLFLKNDIHKKRQTVDQVSVKDRYVFNKNKEDVLIHVDYKI